MTALLATLLRWVETALPFVNSQIQLRVNRHLRAGLAAGSIALVAILLYLGKITQGQAEHAFFDIGLAFGVSFKIGQGPQTEPAFAVRQVPTTISMNPADTKIAANTPLVSVLVPVAKPPTTADVASATALGPEFDATRH